MSVRIGHCVTPFNASLADKQTNLLVTAVQWMHSRLTGIETTITCDENVKH